MALISQKTAVSGPVGRFVKRQTLPPLIEFVLASSSLNASKKCGIASLTEDARYARRWVGRDDRPALWPPMKELEVLRMSSRCWKDVRFEADPTNAKL